MRFSSPKAPRVPRIELSAENATEKESKSVQKCSFLTVSRLRKSRRESGPCGIDSTPPTTYDATEISNIFSQSKIEENRQALQGLNFRVRKAPQVPRLQLSAENAPEKESKSGRKCSFLTMNALPHLFLNVAGHLAWNASAR